MGFAMMADERAIRSIHDSAIGADDIRNAPVFQRTRSHFMRFQALRITSGDVAPQPLRDRRAKLGCDTRLWMFQERKDRRCVLKYITCEKKTPPIINQKLFFLDSGAQRWARREGENGEWKDNYIVITSEDHFR